MPDHPPPRSAGVPQGEGVGPDLDHVVAARRLAPADLAGAPDRLRVVDAMCSLADARIPTGTLLLGAPVAYVSFRISCRPIREFVPPPFAGELVSWTIKIRSSHAT